MSSDMAINGSRGLTPALQPSPKSPPHHAATIQQANAPSNAAPITSKHEVKKSFFGKLKDLAARVVRAIGNFFKAIGAFFQRIFCGKTEAVQPSQPVSKAAPSASNSSTPPSIQKAEKSKPKQDLDPVRALGNSLEPQRKGLFSAELFQDLPSTPNFSMVSACNGLLHIDRMLEEGQSLTHENAGSFIRAIFEDAAKKAKEVSQQGVICLQDLVYKIFPQFKRVIPGPFTVEEIDKLLIPGQLSRFVWQDTASGRSSFGVVDLREGRNNAYHGLLSSVYGKEIEVTDPDMLRYALIRQEKWGSLWYLEKSDGF